MKNDETILNVYLKEINKIPLLNYTEEKELAEKAAKGDKAAKDKIIKSNLRFVVNVAKKYRNHGLDIEDLISEGNLGLLTAIEHFDIKKGYHFISYAVWWIRQSILKAIYEKGRAIRLPLNKTNELVQIENARKTIATENLSDNEEIVEIGRILGMEASHVKEMLEISREMVSLDSKVASDDAGKNTVADFIEDKKYGSTDDEAMFNSMKADINSVLSTLKPKERTVIRLRYGLNGAKPMSLKEVGDVCNLTKERIRQIEKHALVAMKSPKKAMLLSCYVA